MQGRPTETVVKGIQGDLSTVLTLPQTSGSCVGWSLGGQSVLNQVIRIIECHCTNYEILFFYFRLSRSIYKNNKIFKLDSTEPDLIYACNGLDLYKIYLYTNKS